MQGSIRRVAVPLLTLILGACAATDSSAPTPTSSAYLPVPDGMSAVEERDFAGTLLLADRFSQPPIDPAKWRVFTEIPVWGHARVFIDDGRVVFENRGYLITAEQYRPGEPGGLRITGEWTYGYVGDDFLQVLTRSDGRPDPDNAYSETREGVEFYAAQLWGDANIMSIVGRGGAAGTITELSTPGSLLLASGRTYRFDIRDDGRHLRFTMTDAMDPSQTRTITAVSPYAGTRNYVTIHNREYAPGFDRVSYLDNVRIGRSPQ